MSIFFLLNSNKIFKREVKSIIQEGSKASSKLYLFFFLKTKYNCSTANIFIIMCHALLTFGLCGRKFTDAQQLLRLKLNANLICTQFCVLYNIFSLSKHLLESIVLKALMTKVFTPLGSSEIFLCELLTKFGFC